jgi:hypothetical protein
VKQSISTPVTIGAVVIVVLLAIFAGWRYLSGGDRDKYGRDVSAPGVMPANMGQEMQRRMSAAGAGRPGVSSSAAPSAMQPGMAQEMQRRMGAAGGASQVGGTARAALGGMGQ